MTSSRHHASLDVRVKLQEKPSSHKLQPAEDKPATETASLITAIIERFISDHLQDSKLGQPAIAELVRALTDAASTPSKLQSREPSVEPKEWRNLLKHLANLVSYMMKSSSIFTNFAALFCRKGATACPKRDLIKAKSVKFAEEIFERHRVIVQLIKRFESDSSASLATLLPFAKKISESGKEELTCQEEYLSAVIEAIGKD